MANQNSNTMATTPDNSTAAKTQNKLSGEKATNLNPEAKMEEPGANMLDQKNQMSTLSSILEKLRMKKMDNEFRWTPEGFTAGKGKTYQPEELTIIKTYRFEGESDPSDMEILYIIEAKDGLIGL